MNINLLPQESMGKRYHISLITLASYAMGILLVVVGVLSYFVQAKASADQSSLAMINAQLSAVQSSVQQIQTKLSNNLSTDGQGGTSTSLAHADVHALFVSVKNASPRGVKILSMNWDGKSITISATAASPNLIANYIDALVKLGALSNVWVPNVSNSAHGVSQFSVTATLSGGAAQ